MSKIKDITGQELHPLTEITPGISQDPQRAGEKFYVHTQYLLDITSEDDWYQPPHLEKINNNLANLYPANLEHPKTLEIMPLTGMLKADILYSQHPEDWYERCLADSQIHRMMIQQDYDRRDPGEFEMDLDNIFGKHTAKADYGYDRATPLQTEHLDWSALSGPVRGLHSAPDPEKTRTGMERNLFGDNLTIRMSFLPEKGWLNYPHKLDLTGTFCKVTFDRVLQTNPRIDNWSICRTQDLVDQMQKSGWTTRETNQKNQENLGMGNALYPPRDLPLHEALQRLEITVPRVVLTNQRDKKGKVVYLDNDQNQEIEDTLLCNTMRGVYTDMQFPHSMKQEKTAEAELAIGRSFTRG